MRSFLLPTQSRSIFVGHAARLIVAAAALTAAALPVLARPQQAPSSRIVLELPDAFEPAALFSGFTNEAQGVSYVVVELPEKAFEELAAGMTPETLAAKGVANARREKLGRAEPYLYMQAEQASPAGRFGKFFVVFRENSVTVLITANVEKASLDSGAVKAAEIEQVLASARVADTAAPQHDIFKLRHLGPFKPAGQILGTARMFTVDGRAGPSEKAAGRPMLIVAPSLDRRTVLDADAYAEGLLQGLPGLTGARVMERRKISAGGLDGIEMVATATDSENGAEILVYQTLLMIRPGGYFRILGQVAKDKQAEFVEEFRRIAEGFEPIP